MKTNELVRALSALLLASLLSACSRSTPPAPGASAEPATPTATSAALASGDGGAPHAAGDETRPVGAFSRLAVSGPFTLNVTVGGSAGSLRLRCPATLLARVQVDVKDGTLEVRLQDGQPTPVDEPCVLDVGATSLTALTLSGSGTAHVAGTANGLSAITSSGSGDLAVDELKVDDLHVTTSGSGKLRFRKVAAQRASATLSGSGEVELAGRGTKLTIQCMGSGKVRADHFPAEDVEVMLTGSGEAHVHATKSVDATVVGSGHVRVDGAPRQRNDHGARSGAVTYGS